MIWFILGVLIGHYVLPDLKRLVSEKREGN